MTTLTRSAWCLSRRRRWNFSSSVIFLFLEVQRQEIEDQVTARLKAERTSLTEQIRIKERKWNWTVQIVLVLDNLTSMSGEIEGVIGGQKLLPSMDTFSLETIVEDEKQWGHKRRKTSNYRSQMLNNRSNGQVRYSEVPTLPENQSNAINLRCSLCELSGLKEN